MIAPEEALRIVLAHAPRLEAVEVPLLDAVGAVLAQPVASDIDLPPFDKSAMDGYAVRAADVAQTPVELEVIEELPAGVTPTRTVRAGQCAKIMTGAPVPLGADRVVKVEDTEPAGERRVRILGTGPAKRNICERGEDVARGEVVLEAGAAVRPNEVGLLASVGRDRVRVYRRPSVAVLGTGNELVPITQAPGPGQIRDANSWSLLACCRREGVPVAGLGVALDTEASLGETISAGLAHDVLLVSGGVSMGEWDLVPKVFADLGIEVHFATVRMKPGKPTVFATRGPRLVFGLPGNPVSTLVTFWLFVRPALRQMMGHAHPVPPTIPATLAAPVTAKGKRIAFLPARLRREGGVWLADPIKTHGSADLPAFCRADALLRFEPGAHDAGAAVEAIPLWT